MSDGVRIRTTRSDSKHKNLKDFCITSLKDLYLDTEKRHTIILCAQDAYGGMEFNEKDT